MKKPLSRPIFLDQKCGGVAVEGQSGKWGDKGNLG
jgi:hypothetical protein